MVRAMRQALDRGFIEKELEDICTQHEYLRYFDQNLFMWAPYKQLSKVESVK